MQIILAATKIENKWEGALLLNGSLKRVMTDIALGTLAAKLVNPHLIALTDTPDGTEVTYTINVASPEELASRGPNGSAS